MIALELIKKLKNITYNKKFLIIYEVVSLMASPHLDKHVTRERYVEGSFKDSNRDVGYL